MIPPLLNEIQIDGHVCRVMHGSQNYKCQRFKLSTHKLEDSANCPAYVENQNLLPFRYDDHVLSNMYLCDIMHNNTSFKSAEHAYQHSKCIAFNKTDIAEKILSASTAREAKLLTENASQNPADLEAWRRSNVKIMENIIKCKANSCGAFKNMLINSGDKLLAEATIDEFWGAGLTLSQIKNTARKYFKGSNVLR